MTPASIPPWFGAGTLSRFLLLYALLAGLLAFTPSMVLFEFYRTNEFRGLFLLGGIAMMGSAMAVMLPLHWLVYRWASRQRRHVYAVLLSCGAAIVLNLVYVI